MQHKRQHRRHRQEVDEATQGDRRDQAEEPKYDKEKSDGSEHRRNGFVLYRRIRRAAGVPNSLPFSIKPLKFIRKSTAQYFRRILHGFSLGSVQAAR